MWLLPILSPLTRFAAGVYYRLYLSGEPVPRDGPLLLVANHPNSLLDPALVAAAARRPIRFLAKAPLLRHPLVGWMVRGAGSIPVYRRSDDPGLMTRNEEMFRAAHAALASGSALALFPEGLSNNEPALAPLKTGAARIALGAAALLGRAFPVVPAGLSFREKDVFRSEAAVVVGRALEWSDLAHRGAADADAVRELTARIDAALRDVTINLEHWGVPDPAAVEGTDDEKRRAFRDTFLVLRRRIELVACLPFDKLQGLTLQQRLNQIGRE